MSGGPQATVDATPALELREVTKVYSGARALDNVSLEVAHGEIFGLLGPNGAGKSTLVKVALTLTRQTSGRVLIAGIDTISDEAKARRLMGYVPQEVSVDPDLSGFENLLAFAKLYNIKREERRPRIKHALDAMGLEEKANALTKTYSGGMKRRLEIAQAIVCRPRLMFLDEPTVGLDPPSKNEVWRLILELCGSLKTTILLTTHDMVEAEKLCHRVAIINRGKVIVVGTPEHLKSLVGGEVVTLRFTRPLGVDVAKTVRFPPDLGATILPEAKGLEPETEVSVAVKVGAEKAAPAVARAFEAAGLEVDSISYSRPSLDDVFLKFTLARIGREETRLALGGESPWR